MLDDFLRSWPVAPWLANSLIVTAVFYIAGWRELHRRDPDRWNTSRLIAFVAGLATIYLALASPIEVFASFFLSAHMVQHLLLLLVAPPLIWLGWPLIPILRGLPEPVRIYWAAPLLRWRWLKRFTSRLVQPLVALSIFIAATWIWHLPLAYNLGLTNDRWHIVQHACFMTAALIFWFPVVRPYPHRANWPKWWLLPYLLIADLQNTALAAWFTFSPDVLYSHYLQMPRINGIAAIDDQRIAGLLMWIPGSVALLLPLFWITISYLIGETRRTARPRQSPRVQVALVPKPFDLLKVSGIGPLLRSRAVRRVLQTASLAAAALIVLDGFRGPQFAPMNLAGVIPWIHWRGILILTLLVAGNFFCAGCPFTLPRSIAKRLPIVGRPWPRLLRSKWLAVLLVILFLWSYEAFALWNNVWITAWIVLGYFLAALLIDTFFSTGSFCKYVCPIGQFNFVQSLMSPLTVAVRQPLVCSTCTTMECIAGSGNVSGCQTGLFLPSKRGNLDCTFCLDCVHACPHDNIGILVASPGGTLWADPHRAGIGRFSGRADLAALILVLVFGAFANAAGMIGPVVEWQQRLRLALGEPSPLLITTLSYISALIVVPLLTVTVAGLTSQRWARHDDSVLRVVTRFTFALVPLGFGMWVAHYSFHFFTSWQSIFPVTQRFAIDYGYTAFGAPAWQCACCSSAAAWIPQFELLMLDLGLLGSLYTAFRIAKSNTTSAAQAAKLFAPWAILVIILFIVGVWIIFQPMEMRGTLAIAG